MHVVEESACAWLLVSGAPRIHSRATARRIKLTTIVISNRGTRGTISV